MVLKATHLPFVAVIWAYEGSVRFMSRKLLSPPSTALPRSSGRPLSTCQASNGRSAQSSSALIRPHPLAPTTPTKEPLAVPVHYITSAAAPPDTADNVADLLSLVQKLSSQVEELTSMVAGQQKD